ncbi:MAG: ComEC/Rec2 family competence protein [candidate division SR1 bacterium]|nr:ComEC/Rec2 family competence protein [candidate division SR1 bacterium]
MKKRKISLKKQLLLLSGAFLLANASCLVFWFRTAPEISSDFFHFKAQSESSQRTTLLGNYLISEQTKPDTYLVASSDGKNYLLKSEQLLEIGKIYQIGAKYKPLDLANTYSQFSNHNSESGFSLSGFFDYQFNYDKWLLMKGYYGSLYSNFSVILEKESSISGFERITQDTRLSLKNLISSLFPDRKGGLLLAMLIGDKSQLPKQDYQGFIDSGIVHIITVSGGNLVMIVVFLGAILFWMPFYIRNAFIILGVVFFAILAGNDSSVIRALIMSVLSLLALFWGREVQIWRLLKYAFVLMLCYNPYFLVYDLGFLLSFGALIGIVILSEVLSGGNNEKEDQKEKKSGFRFLSSFLKNYGIPTLGASIGTLPVLLFFIGTTNLSGIVINLIIVPLVPLITIGGFMSAILIKLTDWDRLKYPIQWLLEFIYYCSELANQFSFKISIENLLIKYLFAGLVVGILICCYLITKKKQ